MNKINSILKLIAEEKKDLPKEIQKLLKEFKYTKEIVVKDIDSVGNIKTANIVLKDSDFPISVLKKLSNNKFLQNMSSKQVELEVQWIEKDGKITTRQ